MMSKLMADGPLFGQTTHETEGKHSFNTSNQQAGKLQFDTETIS